MLEHFSAADYEGIVLDESSILKSFDGTFRNQIIEAFAQTPFRLACTATPAPNDYMELGNHSEFLGALSRTEMLSTFFVHDGGETSKWRLKRHAQADFWKWVRSEEHTSELQSQSKLVCRLLLGKKKRQPISARHRAPHRPT